ncbi:MAG: tetratricopeptide repeat protein [Chthoniobacteraceae bacterium]
MRLRHSPYLPALLLTVGLMASPIGLPWPAYSQGVVTEQDVMLGLFKQAAGAFQQGNFQAAATALETLLGKAGKDAQLESVYYLLGASYFNLGQYDKAVENLRKYQTNYPSGGRVAEVTLSLGQALMLQKDDAGAIREFSKLEGNAALHDDALSCKAQAQRESGDVPGAIATYEKLVAGGIRSPMIATSAIALVELYAKQGAMAFPKGVLAQVRAALDVSGRARGDRVGCDRAPMLTRRARLEAHDFAGSRLLRTRRASPRGGRRRPDTRLRRIPLEQRRHGRTLCAPIPR